VLATIKSGLMFKILCFHSPVATGDVTSQPVMLETRSKAQVVKVIPRREKRLEVFTIVWNSFSSATAAGSAELLSFVAFPRHLWRKLRTTNVIEGCFLEVRRRTRPMVCFVNVESVDRIIYSIFQRFNLEWKTRTLNLFTQAA